MKKKVLAAILIIAALFMLYFFGSGFTKNTSAYIGEFSVSKDGKEITVNVGVSSSIGYIRAVSVHQQEGGKLYLDFYSAFGGVNGSIGAKNVFTLPLDENSSLIAVYRGTNCYEELLLKDQNGVWQRTGRS